ncbi:unnamed protein product [Closterium sp. NIES-65]|nr:unnamed protein product [Closterium sp. NIES-65]
MFCPPSLSIPPPCLQASTKYYGIRGIERTGFYGWFGLMLAVQQQPVIVHIEASAPSFQDYDGVRHPPSKTTMGGKYADEECFSNHLNHVVLVVGYLSAGSDPSTSVLAPFWIIRNSWGTGWGDQGHMRMDIRSGDGICGINTLPGLFPVVRSSADPCGSRSFQYSIQGPAFNPCGRYNCSKKGTSNRCKCTDARFAQHALPIHLPMPSVHAPHACAHAAPTFLSSPPVDVCGSSTRNPCVVGTCVNDGKGSYSCVCPPGFIQGTTLANTASCAPGNTPLLLSSCAPGNTPVLLSSCAPGTCSLLLCSGYLLSPPVLRVPALSSCAPGTCSLLLCSGYLLSPPVLRVPSLSSCAPGTCSLLLSSGYLLSPPVFRLPALSSCAPDTCSLLLCSGYLLSPPVFRLPALSSCAPDTCSLLLCSGYLLSPPVLRVPALSSCAPGNHPSAALYCPPPVFRVATMFCPPPVFRFLQQNKVPECCTAPIGFMHSTGDTCTRVGRQVELCGAAASDAACEAAFQALNPAVDCSSLRPSQAVCIERDPGVANVTVVCDQYYRARLNDTCDSIRQLAEPPLSPVAFYRLNPGVNCNQLIPLKNHSRSATTFGAEVCIGSITNFTAGMCSRTSTYTISPGDDCKYINVKYFYSIKGCYRRMNGYECVDKLKPGVKICTPSANKARIGSCRI